MRWPDERDEELFAGLQALLAVAMQRPTARRVPSVVVDLLEQLHDAQEQAVSGAGHPSSGHERLKGMSRVTADEAGREVGLSGRQVRRLCTAGLVRHHVTRAGYEVDLADLQRHLAGAP